jgi:hypothetical protein
MAILIGETIKAALSSAPSHEDRFGKGGYVVIASGLLTTATDSAINSAYPTGYQKAGMLIFDTDTQKEYRCTTPGSWQVVQAATGDIDGGTY